MFTPKADSVTFRSTLGTTSKTVHVRAQFTELISYSCRGRASALKSLSRKSFAADVQTVKINPKIDFIRVGTHNIIT